MTSYLPNDAFPLRVGPLGSTRSAAQTGLDTLAASLGSLFENLQSTGKGDLLIKVQSANECLENEGREGVSQILEGPTGRIFHANACIVCQRVPYLAAALRFASQQQAKQSLPFQSRTPFSSTPLVLHICNEDCSASGLQAVLTWAYTGSFEATDWQHALEILQAGAFLGATEVVRLLEELLVGVALPVGRELDKLSSSTIGAQVEALGSLSAASLCTLHCGGVEESSQSGSCQPACSSENDPGEQSGALLDFVVGSLTVLTCCGEDASAGQLLAKACPSLGSALVVLTNLDERVDIRVLELLLKRLDELRTEAVIVAKQEASLNGDIDAIVFGATHRWWAFDPAARFAQARALLDEHICLGALSVRVLESILASLRENCSVSATFGSLVKQEEVEAAYRFALRTDNEHGRSRHLLRLSVGRWKWQEMGKAWQSWHEYSQGGLGTSGLVLAKKAMRVWSLRSAARLFTAWRQAALEGRIEERKQLALWKWQKACQKLLRAKR